MTEKTIIYFEKPGPKNTEAVVKAVVAKVKELGLKYVVLASNSGATALKFWEALQGMGVTTVSVTEHSGFSGGDKPGLEPAQRKALEEKGIQVVVASHVLSGVGRSITKKFGGVTHVEMIAHTLRLFGTDGFKVAVEVAVMAADAGLVPTDQEIAAVGGSGAGADTAVTLKAAHMNNFFDLEIREIIAKPRQRRATNDK
jgi:hypothetical protein